MRFRRGQEEMVGFVLIMILLAIIFLVLLTISLRANKGSEMESKEVVLVLESIQEYTTDCAIGYETNLRKMSDLVKDCDSGKTCLSGADSCEVLRNGTREIMAKIYTVGNGSRISSYYFSGEFINPDGSKREIVETIFPAAGTACQTNLRTAQKPLPGGYVLTLTVCLSDED
jgi:hypothetical protein